MNEEFERMPFENDLPPPGTPTKIGAALAQTPETPAQSRNAIVEVEASRAIQEVQASLVIAKRFPRDEVDAERRILTSCKRYSFAERAFFSYPRGKDESGKKNVVKGPTIRMAEMLAQAWGNIDYGFTELDRSEGRSIVESFAWDKETNTRSKRVVSVDLKLQFKNGGTKILTDPRDQYEMMANQAQRRTRSCILQIVPADIVEKAVQQCNKTLALGEKAEPLIDRVKRMVVVFSELSVTKEKIEKRLGHKIEETTPEEVVEMIGIYNGIKEGSTRREDWFDYGAPDGTKAGELNAALLKDEKKK